ncbi:hypothetical protein BGV40_02505 [Methanosarcina sp. Ant1]|nr:hypothetical protein BGV40_02505 [Methanosarcina sp. Ant1]
MRKVIAILIAVCFVLSMTAAAASAHSIKNSYNHKYTKITKTTIAKQEANLHNNQNNKVTNTILNLGDNYAKGTCGVKAGNSNSIVTTATNKNENTVNQIILQ